jgi:hypothetical protein
MDVAEVMPEGHDPQLSDTNDGDDKDDSNRKDKKQKRTKTGCLSMFGHSSSPYLTTDIGSCDTKLICI